MDIEVLHARGLFARMKGLIGTRAWPRGRALLIRPCNAVHTCFMRYPIDLVFLDRRGCIVKIVLGVHPWRLSVAWRATAVVELTQGEATRLGWHVGTSLQSIVR